MGSSTINREEHPLYTGPDAINLSAKKPVATRKSSTGATGRRASVDDATHTEDDQAADVEEQDERAASRATARSAARQAFGKSRSTDELEEEERGEGTHRMPLQSRRTAYRARRPSWREDARNVRWEGLSEIGPSLGRIGLGLLGGLLVAYTLLFFLVTFSIYVLNTWNYGQTRTSYTAARLNGQDATIASANVNGTIYVTIYQKQKDGSITSHTFTGPTLTSHLSDGDITDGVATAEVGQTRGGETITVSVTGNVNYLRPFFLFGRPQTQFHVVPARAGYRIVPS